MKTIIKLLLACLLIAMSVSKASATHLIGSEMYYVDLGNGEYLITLKVYRECGPANTEGTGFDDDIILGVFNPLTGSQIDQYSVFLNNSTVQNVPIVMTNPCGTPPPDLCVEEATYTQTIYLGSSPNGFDVLWQRCCRNPTISNLQNFGGTDNPGMTTTIHIPGTNQLSSNENNSSPVFQEFPPVALCANFEFFFDHGAIDPDGDELVYSFCAPFNGGGAEPGTGFNSPAPNPPAGPPYNDVPYAAGYSAAYPIAADPAFEIDPVTGFITGTPNMPGQYAMGICVEEYRDGVYLGRVIRDFQFNVTLCDANIISAVTPQQPEQLCIGETMTFTNTSINAEDYLWDFGVSGTDSDISTEFEPTFTFPDTGTYVVTLIANPTWPCADTASQIFDVFEPLDPVIELDFNCVAGNEFFDFEVTGNINSEATYFWDFITGTPNTSNLSTPQNIGFNNDENWSVDLTVNNHGCTSNATFDYVAPPDPISSIEDQTGFCQGLTFEFVNNSENAETYLWDFGTNLPDNLSNEFEPEFSYPDSGTYTVTLTAYAPFTCPDASTATVEIHYLLEPFFEDPEPDCHSTHNFSLTGVASVDVNTVYTWDFGGDVLSANINGPSVSNLVYAEPGTYEVTLTAEVPGLQGCEQSYTGEAYAIEDPTVNFTAGPLEGCPPHLVSFTNTSSTLTATTYEWEFGDGHTSTAVSPTHVYEYSGSFDVSLQMITGGFCENTLINLQENLVNTYPVPFAAFDVEPNQVDILTPVVYVTNIGDSNVDCYYNFGDGGSMQTLNGSYTYSDGGLFTITQTVINEYGCTDTATGEVSVSGSVFYAPNMFTPDGDGVNDYWLPIILGASKYSLKVFNRWGELIWSTEDTTQPWVGEAKTGGEYYAPDGMYIWEAKWMDQVGMPQVKKGYVFLTR